MNYFLNVQFQRDLPSFDSIIEGMRELTGLNVIGEIFDNSKRIKEFRNESNSSIEIPDDIEVTYYCNLKCKGFKMVRLTRIEKDLTFELIADYAPPYYLFDVLVYILKTKGGKLDEEYELPKWASMNWKDKKWWQRIPH